MDESILHCESFAVLPSRFGPLRVVVVIRAHWSLCTVILFNGTQGLAKNDFAHNFAQ